MKVGRGNHSWCMCVVINGCSELGGAGMGVVDACGTNRGVSRMSGDAGALPECELIH